MGWGHGCRQVRLCVSITLGNLLGSEMPELRAESSPLLSPCPQLCAGVLHPSSPSAGSWHHPLLPLLWFSKPWPCGDAPTHSPQPQPLHSCFSLLLFLLFHSSFIFFFFSLSPSKPPQAPSDIPLQTIYSPTPIAPSQPSAPAFLSWLCCLGRRDQVWARQTPSVPFHTFDSSFPSSPVQTCLPACPWMCAGSGVALELSPHPLADLHLSGTAHLALSSRMSLTARSGR